MYNWQFDGFMWMNVLSAYFGLYNRIEYQADIMRMFGQHGTFEGREKELSQAERSMLEQIASEDSIGKPGRK